MLTIFTIPKAFEGHYGLIQRNAIGSWRELNPKCEVILFGDEPGTRETAGRFQLRYEPEIPRNEFGTPLLAPIFARAQEMATHDLLCYVNCDIVLLQCFSEALLAVARSFSKFLMVGRRWNTPVTQLIEFQRPDWEAQIRASATHSGQQGPPYAVDYFVFPRGVYGDTPPFAVGRFYWDHWLVWKARSMKVPVVDASASVLAIHQEHGFPGQPPGGRDQDTDPEAKRNRALAGGLLHLYTIKHCTHGLARGQIAKRRGAWHVPATNVLATYSSKLWYWLLSSTFQARRTIGLYRLVASTNSVE